MSNIYTLGAQLGERSTGGVYTCGAAHHPQPEPDISLLSGGATTTSVLADQWGPYPYVIQLANGTHTWQNTATYSEVMVANSVGKLLSGSWEHQGYDWTFTIRVLFTFSQSVQYKWAWINAWMQGSEGDGQNPEYIRIKHTTGVTDTSLLTANTYYSGPYYLGWAYQFKTVQLLFYGNLQGWPDSGPQTRVATCYAKIALFNGWDNPYTGAVYTGDVRLA